MAVEEAKARARAEGWIVKTLASCRQQANGDWIVTLAVRARDEVPGVTPPIGHGTPGVGDLVRLNEDGTGRYRVNDVTADGLLRLTFAETRGTTKAVVVETPSHGLRWDPQWGAWRR